MRDLTITAIIKVYQYDELNESDRALVTTAKEATARSYVPYSHFSVGAAALLGDGTVVSGTNQENAAYPSGLCAERTTLFYANSRYPDQPVITLAIAARTEKDFIDNPIPRHCRTQRAQRVPGVSHSSLRCLPPGDSRNGETLRATDPHSALRQRMHLRN